MFIMSLAIADLTVGVIVMPISAAYAITGRIFFVPSPLVIFKQNHIYENKYLVKSFVRCIVGFIWF